MDGQQDESGQVTQHGAENVAYSIGSPTIYDDDEIDMSFLKDMEDELAGDDSYVPQTPIDHPPAPLSQPPSPRQSPTSRAHEDTAEGEESHDAKKARAEIQKKQRIGMLGEMARERDQNSEVW